MPADDKKVVHFVPAHLRTFRVVIPNRIIGECARISLESFEQNISLESFIVHAVEFYIAWEGLEKPRAPRPRRKRYVER